MSDDYHVGYGKPPKQHQFKAGNQAARGKKRRKRKQGLSMPEIIDKALHTKRTIKKGGELLEMEAADVMVERLVQVMMSGTPRELVLMVSLLEKYTPDTLASAPEKLEVSYHRAEGSTVALPPKDIWEGDEP